MNSRAAATFAGSSFAGSGSSGIACIMGCGGWGWEAFPGSMVWAFAGKARAERKIAATNAFARPAESFSANCIAWFLCCATPRKPAPSILQFDFVFFDNGVGKQSFAHLLKAGAGHFHVGSAQIDIDDLALPHFAHLGKAEAVQRMANGLTLRIEHAALQSDENAGFHGQRTRTGPLASPCTDSGMMPRRFATSE